MLSSSSVVSNPMEPKSTLAAQKSTNSSGVVLKEKGVSENSKGFIGFLEVFIHQARDIHNICIYQKQDVYAKICLTDDPETTVSTQTVNGGGRNPVFNENLRLNVRNIESSLKCEVWMLSRVRNYLEDQLLGFALVPLADVLIKNGKLAQEFTLSSSDIFHSPSGFVELTLVYNGAAPEVLEMPSPRRALVASAAAQDKEGLDSVGGEFGMIEFLDPKIVNENEMMVTEYYGIPPANLESENSKILDSANDDNQLDSNIAAHVVEPFTVEGNDAIAVSRTVTPPSSVSTNGFPPISVPEASKSLNQDIISPLKEKPEIVGVISPLKEKMKIVDAVSPVKEKTEIVDVISPMKEKLEIVEDVSPMKDKTETIDVISPQKEKAEISGVVSPLDEKTEIVGKTENGSSAVPISTAAKPLIRLTVEPEQKVVQQDYVDMYMKSMQQFTEALANMKLPLDVGNVSTGSKEKDSADTPQASKENGPGPSPRVFYGSRAFF